jgi:iron(III) transport system substrate-binding protein
VRYFDLFFAGSGVGETLAHAGMLEPLEPLMILPEVKDPSRWWGGHIWEDNAKTGRFVYSFVADAGTGSLWINAEAAKEEEVRSFDDLLHPKWNGRIAFLDPRNPGPGDSIWSFLWDKKGQEYLKKLVAQDLLISTDYRQITDALAKGRVVISVGPTRHQYEPYIKAGLPVKELPVPREGLPTSNGFGTMGVLNNAPHPNAARVFLNWLLGPEGQALYSRAMIQATRRLDVETKWMAAVGTRAAKDVMSVEDYHRLRNHLEDQVIRVRVPAMKFAREILK